MVKKYTTYKIYICKHTNEQCMHETTKYSDSHPGCDDCEIYLTHNNLPIEEKMYTKFMIHNGVEIGIE